MYSSQVDFKVKFAITFGKVRSLTASGPFDSFCTLLGAHFPSTQQCSGFMWVLGWDVRDVNTGPHHVSLRTIRGILAMGNSWIFLSEEL